MSDTRELMRSKIHWDGDLSRHPNCSRPGAVFQSRKIIPLFVLLIFSFLSGCSSPNRANIELRKQNQALRDEIASLKQQHDADVATIRGMEEQRGTLQTLPADRLAKLYTVHGLKLGRLTGGADLDRNKPGDEGLKVYIVPVDEDGDAMKAAGTFTVEAFDLSSGSEVRAGRWEFDLEQTRKAWYGALLKSYVLTCPWQNAPQHRELTVKVTFVDALTGRVLTVQTVGKVDISAPPPETRSAGTKGQT
jgi:hypothetical protein